jgi:hypothetical protein
MAAPEEDSDTEIHIGSLSRERSLTGGNNLVAKSALTSKHATIRLDDIKSQANIKPQKKENLKYVSPRPSYQNQKGKNIVNPPELEVVNQFVPEGQRSGVQISKQDPTQQSESITLKQI